MSSTEAAILAKLEHLTAVVEKLQEQRKHWYTTGEAIDYLGLGGSEVGERRLVWFRTHAYLNNLRPGKPNLYDGKEIEKLRKRLDDGTIKMPKVK
jgi:hypothetical protein